jgi:hypothetical protein
MDNGCAQEELDSNPATHTHTHTHTHTWIMVVRRKNWIRIPAIIYASHAVTQVALHCPFIFILFFFFWVNQVALPCLQPRTHTLTPPPFIIICNVIMIELA